MGKRLSVKFEATGECDGPIAAEALANLGHEEMAYIFATGLKDVILASAEDEKTKCDVNVRATVRVYDEEETGHAEA